ncbi:hypothetical protein COCSADRAFT_268788 [Bipolaris sorokiniana ND90Pr]|uniref:Transmembrane protein n=1 Tax=Cochliobolus sativus (strain ND90Pr / ATCC 201652) TaxID=665912 RepID=M2SLR6_COCSN|nr:uncharacterized protein COCSADRAFT_268788 [Bipolaris sorokiniana ND90Pr]EMD68098.1 hypothetical protein COCSADRAFT_268788 [Bipolaris sorokiniana ND90Pr]
MLSPSPEENQAKPFWQSRASPSSLIRKKSRGDTRSTLFFCLFLSLSVSPVLLVHFLFFLSFFLLAICREGGGGVSSLKIFFFGIHTAVSVLD